MLAVEIEAPVPKEAEVAVGRRAREHQGLDGSEPGRQAGLFLALLLLRYPKSFLVEADRQTNAARDELIQKRLDGGDHSGTFGCEEDTDCSRLRDSQGDRDVPPSPLVDGCRGAKLSCQGQNLTLTAIQPKRKLVDHRPVRDLKDSQPARLREGAGSRQALISRDFLINRSGHRDLPEKLGQEVEPSDPRQ